MVGVVGSGGGWNSLYLVIFKLHPADLTYSKDRIG